MLSANQGHTEIVKLLLAISAVDATLRDKVRWYYYCYSCKCNSCTSVMKLTVLIYVHIVMCFTFQTGATALKLATTKEIQLLLEGRNSIVAGADSRKRGRE